MPRRASAACTASRSVRMRRMSNMGLDGTRRPRPRTTGKPEGATSVTPMPALEVNDLVVAYGTTRAGFSASTAISRKDFGIDFNVPLGGDKVLIADKVTLELDVQLIAP